MPIWSQSILCYRIIAKFSSLLSPPAAALRASDDELVDGKHEAHVGDHVAEVGEHSPVQRPQPAPPHHVADSDLPVRRLLARSHVLAGIREERRDDFGDACRHQGLADGLEWSELGGIWRKK